MRPATDDRSSYWPLTPAHPDDLELHRRVLAEFREMPGLRLTLTQAARLFDIEPTQCQRVLGSLVDAGRLATDGRQFAAADGVR